MASHSQYILTHLCIPLYTQNFAFLNDVFLYDMVQKYTVHMKTILRVSYLSTWQCMCKVTFAHTERWNSHATHVNLLYYTCMSRMYCIWMSNVNPVAGVSRTYVWWWRHQTETLSAWLALCAGKFTGHRCIPSQSPVTRRFDVFFYLHLNKRLSKQLWGWWFELLSCSLWRHCIL